MSSSLKFFLAHKKLEQNFLQSFFFLDIYEFNRDWVWLADDASNIDWFCQRRQMMITPGSDYIKLLEYPIPATATAPTAPSQKTSHGDILGTKRGIIDPKWSKMVQNGQDGPKWSTFSKIV